MPFASVKVTYVKLPEPQRILIEHRARQLHDSRPVGPEECGSHRAARIDLDERETIRRKLKKVGRRNGFDLLRRRPVGLVVDDQHLVAQVDEAVDLADELAAAPPSLWGWGAAPRSAPRRGSAGRTGARTPARVRIASVSAHDALARAAGDSAAPRRSMKPFAASVPARLRQRRQVLQQCVGERAAQEAAVLAERGRGDGRLGPLARSRAAPPAAPLPRRARTPRAARARAGSQWSARAARPSSPRPAAARARSRPSMHPCRPSRRRIARSTRRHTVSPSDAVALVRPALRASCDEIVPAAVGTRLLAFEAGDVEPVARARHGDVEQPVALLGLEGCAHLACRRRPRRALPCP